MPTFPNPIKTTTFSQFIEKLFEILEKVAFVGLAFAIVYAGYLFSTAEGNPDKLSQAKKALFWGIIGAGIIFLGKYLVKEIIKLIP